MGFPGGSEDKASACNAGDTGLIPGLGRSPGEGNGNPLQYSCLENPTERGAWRAIVHGVTKSRTRLSDFTHTHTHTHTHTQLPNSDMSAWKPVLKRQVLIGLKMLLYSGGWLPGDKVDSYPQKSTLKIQLTMKVFKEKNHLRMVRVLFIFCCFQIYFWVLVVR